MNTGNMSDFVKQINQYNPDAIIAYVNPLYQLAKYLLEHKIKITSPKTIITGAEALYAFQRQAIEEAFSCKAYNTYGCREFMLIAAECHLQNGLHINSDHLVVETLDENGQSTQSKAGDLAITDLSNYGMPLIRYLNGDRARLSNDICSCGNPLPMIEKIEGRKLDVIQTPLGGNIPGEFFPHLFKEFSAINKFQVKQQQLDQINISMVLNRQLTTEESDSINNEINRYSQGSLKINIHKVDEIALTSSGKHRVTICEILDKNN